jgi:hypothetical protein
MFSNVSEVLAASIIRTMMMMEAAKTSETVVKFYQTTRRYNPAIFALNATRTLNPTKNKVFCLAFVVQWYSIHCNTAEPFI